MKYVFFPGCRIKEGYPESSKKLSSYIKKTYHIEPVGCCKENYGLLEEGTCALLICNNCANDLETFSVNQTREFIWEVIDKDPNFVFPDYHGKPFLLQDCNHGYNDEDIKKHVRSLLNKMNISILEMNEEDSIPYGMSRAEHRELVSSNAKKYQEMDVVTYCAICNLAMKKSGKHSVYLLDLLFNEKE